MTPDDVASLFTRSDGSYLCARWGRPIVPVVFGVDDATLAVVKGACEAVVALAGHQMAETDPELGANLMVFFIRDWAELSETPGLSDLVPDLETLLTRLQNAEANQYRLFRATDEGAIRAAFVFLRMDTELSQVPAETLCLVQMVQTILLWSDAAFTDRPALVRNAEGLAILRPEIGAVIRAAYDPTLPSVATDPSHALRLFARMTAPQ